MLARCDASRYVHEGASRADNTIHALDDAGVPMRSGRATRCRAGSTAPLLLPDAVDSCEGMEPRAGALGLGPRFDIREFHERVLEDGPVPLAFLRQKIQRWIAQNGAGGTG
jgi:hypothetical protein